MLTRRHWSGPTDSVRSAIQRLRTQPFLSIQRGISAVVSASQTNFLTHFVTKQKGTAEEAISYFDLRTRGVFQGQQWTAAGRKPCACLGRSAAVHCWPNEQRLWGRIGRNAQPRRNTAAGWSKKAALPLHVPLRMLSTVRQQTSDALNPETLFAPEVSASGMFRACRTGDIQLCWPTSSTAFARPRSVRSCPLREKCW